MKTDLMHGDEISLSSYGQQAKYHTTHKMYYKWGEILSVALGIQAFEGSTLSRAQYFLN